MYVTWYWSDTWWWLYISTKGSCSSGVMYRVVAFKNRDRRKYLKSIPWCWCPSCCIILRPCIRGGFVWRESYWKVGFCAVYPRISVSVVKDLPFHRGFLPTSFLGLLQVAGRSECISMDSRFDDPTNWLANWAKHPTATWKLVRFEGGTYQLTQNEPREKKTGGQL